MTFKAVVFDLDGTLIDSLEDIAVAMNQVLSNHGYAVHPIDDYRQFVGNGVAKLVERTLPLNASESVRQQCADGFREIYRDACNVKTCVYDGVPGCSTLFEIYAELIDPRIKIRCIACAPNPDNPEYWCEWELEIPQE